MTVARTTPARHEARLAEIGRLARGPHGPAAREWCVMEAVAYVAGEAWSDRPRCACPVIARYALRLNDRLDEAERQRLLPYVVRIAGSRAPGEIARARAYLAATRACKVFAPRALEARGLAGHAATLRALPDITDRATAMTAQATARAAASAAAAAAADAAHAAYAAHAAATAYAAHAAAAAAHAAARATTHAAHAAAAAAAYAAHAAAAAAAAAHPAARARMLDEALGLLDDMLALTA